jgi:Tfp pilus assembly protein PilO
VDSIKGARGSLSDLKWDVVGIWPLSHKIILCFALYGIVVGIGYYTMMQPCLKRYQNAQQEVQCLLKQVEDQCQALANAPKHQEAIQKIQSMCHKKSISIASLRSEVMWLEWISQIAVSHRLKWVSIKPENKNTSVRGGGFVFSLVLSGKYLDFSRFLIEMLNKFKTLIIERIDVQHLMKPEPNTVQVHLMIKIHLLERYSKEDSDD